MPTSNVNGEWQVINWSKSAADEQQLEAELRSFSEEIREMNHVKLEAIICLNEAWIKCGVIVESRLRLETVRVF